MSLPTVLFLTPHAALSGSAIGVLELVRWYATHGGRGRVLIGQDGPLLPQFRSLMPTYLWPQVANNKRVEQDILGDTTLIYCHSLGASGIVRQLLTTTPRPVVIGVRELSYVVEQIADRAFMTQLPARAWYAVASQVVADYLTMTWQVPRERVRVVYEGIRSDERTISERALVRARLRAELGIAGELLVMGMGTVEWRKGADFFLTLGQWLQARPLPVQLVWVGAALETRYLTEILHDLDKLGLRGTVRFIGPRVNARDYLLAADVFTLLSREDPYPLVVLEAAEAHKPIVCFAASGGAPEFVTEATGVVVPYGQVDEFGVAVLALGADASWRQRLGHAAQQRVRMRHGVEQTAQALVDVFRAALA